MKGRVKTCVVLFMPAVLWACASAAVSNAPVGPRIRSAGDLVLADSSEVKPLDVSRFPKFPPDQKAAGEEAAFAVIFVLDTLGRVEYPTVSFGPEVARPFALAVCAYLRDARFTPVVRDGIARRAFVIADWTFALEGGAWYRRQFDTAPLRQAVIASGLVRTSAHMEELAHC